MSKNRRYGEFAHRIDIDAFEEAIGFTGEDDGKGNDVGYCPDPWNLHKHGDSTGKFAIHREKCVFNCWVCGGGTLLSLAMAVEGLSEDDAIDWLAQFAGEPTDERFEVEINNLLKDELRREPVIPWFNERVLDNFDPEDESSPLWEFCMDRDIDPQVAIDHRLGYDDTSVKIAKKGRYEGPGVIFPHFWQGRLVGWQTRWLEADEDRPPWVQKYNNTRDMPKRWTIYDYERWYLTPDPIVVVESVPTALRLQSLGYPSIAIFGASATPEQFKLLRACQQGIVLAPDNDNPGLKVVSKAIDYKLDRYIPVWVCEPVGEEGSGNDLADCDEETVHDLLRHAFELNLLY